MSYIRKKDNEILKVLSTDYKCGFKVYHTETRMITERLVLKEADTIEELCDEFRYKYDNALTHERCFRNSLVKKWFDCNDFTPLSKEEISTIKGAIWTNTGLIYVAKMNDKGELELL